MSAEDYPTPVRGVPAVRAEQQARTQIMGKPITADSVLKTLGAVALAACGWFINGAWNRIEKIEQRQQDFDGRMIRAEERQGESIRTMAEMKEDIKDIKRLLEKRP